MNVAIVGFGRFGRLLAGLLKDVVGQDATLVATSRSDYSEAAGELGISWVDLKRAAAADVVILTVPIRELAAVLDHIRPHVQPGTLVMDTCSVKMYPAKLMAEMLPEEAAVLATHPLFGPDGVRDFGIAGQRVVLCPVRIDETRVAMVEDWYRALGVEVLRCSPEEHDRQVAVSQGLVHFVGRAVERAALREPTLSTSNARRLFELVNSVGRDSRELFHDIEVLNPYSAGVRQRFARAAAEIERELSAIAPDDIAKRG